MKFLFDHCTHYSHDDYHVNLGIGWYKHAPQSGKKFRSWKGITITFYLIRWQLHFTYVNDYEAYRARMDYRYSGFLKDRGK